MSLKNNMLPSQIHKRINFNFDKQKLIFDTSQELFSFAKIDDGTKELLNSLRKNSSINYKNILDLGCGYGVIGIYLKNKFPKAEVLCTDRDSLAVEFTKHNAILNEAKIDAIPSLDFQALQGHPGGKEIKDNFSLIITNFPAKLEKEGLEHFIAKSTEHLEKNGTFALVIVKELDDAITEILKNENISISFKERSKNYSVYHLNFKEKIKSNFSYITSTESFNISEKKINLNTTTALREFDTAHIVTNLILKILENKRFNEATIINPNQGLIPLGAKDLCKVKRLKLVSSDLLQLRISSENLLTNGFKDLSLEQKNMPNSKSDLLIWSIYDEDDKTIEEKLKIYLKNFSSILIGGRLPVLKRVLKKMNISPEETLCLNGYTAIFINSFNEK